MTVWVAQKPCEEARCRVGVLRFEGEVGEAVLGWLDDADLGVVLDPFKGVHGGEFASEALREVRAEDLRQSSQLIIITHQKRTTEIANAFYGVSMRADGISAVVGQRVNQEQAS